VRTVKAKQEHIIESHPSGFLTTCKMSINQSSAAPPLVRASLSLYKFKKQIMIVQKPQIKKHIHKPSALLSLQEGRSFPL
jgi:hypothetical protein